MATEKTPTYTDAQVALIVAAIAANGNIADKDTAEKLAANPEMNDADGNARKARAIIAKMSRMAETHGFTYKRQTPTTKDGKPVTKKTDLVARLAALTDVTAEKLDGLEKAPKLALETLVAALSDAA